MCPSQYLNTHNTTFTYPQCLHLPLNILTLYAMIVVGRCPSRHATFDVQFAGMLGFNDKQCAVTADESLPHVKGKLTASIARRFTPNVEYQPVPAMEIH